MSRDSARKDSSRRAYPLALLSGLLLAASFPKFGHPALRLGVPRAADRGGDAGRARRAQARRPFWLGVLAGVVYFVGTLYWIGGVMATHGGLSPVVRLRCSWSAWPCTSRLFVGAVRAGCSAARSGVSAWRACGSRRCSGSPTEWLRVWLGWEFPWVLLGIVAGDRRARRATRERDGRVRLVGAARAHRHGGRGAGAQPARGASARRDRSSVARSSSVVAWGTWRVSQRRADAARRRPCASASCRATCRRTPSGNPAFRDAILDRYIEPEPAGDWRRRATRAVARGVDAVLFRLRRRPHAAPIRRLAAEARVPFVIGTDDFERGANGQPDRYLQRRGARGHRRPSRAARTARSGSCRSASTCRSSGCCSSSAARRSRQRLHARARRSTVFDVEGTPVQRGDLLRGRLRRHGAGVRRPTDPNC